MSVFDELKGKAAELKDKAADLVGENADKLKDAVGHAGDFINEKTGGKYSGKIDGLQEKASGLIDRTGSAGAPEAPDTQAPETPSPEANARQPESQVTESSVPGAEETRLPDKPADGTPAA